MSSLRSLAGTCLAALCSALSLMPMSWAADADNRGVFDSTVTTIIGGNTGNGATDGTTAPMTALRGGITHDSAGNIYYTDNNRIIKQTGAVISVFAGELTAGTAAEGVKAANARFNTPTLLQTDALGNIYVYDSANNRIRKIDTNQVVTTVVGNGNTTALLADIGRVGTDIALPAAASFGGFVVNSTGDLFFANNTAGVRYIFKVAAADRRLSIFAGDASNGGVTNGNTALGSPLGGNIRSMALLSDDTIIYSINGAVVNIKADGTLAVVAGVLNGANNVVAIDALYPDDGSQNALQLNTAAIFGGVNPGPLAVDGANIYFYDLTERRVRSFTVGGTVKTVFGEVSEKGQSITAGFRGEGTLAAPNTPRLGVIITAGPNGVIDTAAAGDDVLDNVTRPGRIFAGPNGTSDTTVAGDDVQVVASGTAVADDQTPRNDDPRHRIANGGLTAFNNVVTIIDDGNFVVRQLTVGGNVNTIAGTTDANRRNNINNANFDPKKSTNNPIAAVGAPIFNPSQMTGDKAGNLFFDANDINSNHNIWKYDSAAKTVSVVAGRVVTNGYPANPGDGGPAATAKIVGVGTQAAVLADGTIMFADTAFNPASPFTTTTSSTIRAVAPNGIITTIGGIPNLRLTGPNGAPDVDYSIVNAAGAAVNSGRVGQKITDVALANPNAVAGTSTQDFVVVDDWFFLVVQGGIVTVERQFGGQLNGVQDPGYVVFPSPTVAIVGDCGVSSPTRLVRVDFTNPAAVDTTVAANSTGGSIRGLALGTVSGQQVVFVLGTTQIDILDAATLAPIYGTAPTVVDLTGALGGINAGGIFNDGTNLIITDNASDTIRTLALSLFPAGGAGVAAPAPTAGQFPAIAGQFTNVSVNGFQLQTNFEFVNRQPLGLLGTDILVGDDGANQFRRVVLGTAPASTSSVVIGTGVERLGGADGGPALAANVIGTLGGIAVDSTGAIYFTDRAEGTVRKVAGGQITQIAGIPGRFGSNQPNNVAATTVKFSSNLGGVACNAANEVFVADTGNNNVRKIDAGGIIVTVAGIDEGLAGANGDFGDPLLARLNGPGKLIFDANGDLYILEDASSGCRLLVLSKTNVISTFAGGGADRLDYIPTDKFEVEIGSDGLALDTAGKVYFSFENGGSPPSIVGRIAGGFAQAVVGDPVASGFNGDGLSGSQTLLNQPRGLFFDAAIGLAIVDFGNNRVRAVTNLGEATNNPPTAIILTSPDHLGAAPLKIHFDGTASEDADGDIVNYEWDFGDGTKGVGPVVDHVYPITGSFTATLTVTDTQGQSSTAKATIFAAKPLILSATNGKGAFKVSFSTKTTKPSDSFSIAMKNVDGLTNVVGKPAVVNIGTFSVNATVGGKGVKLTDKITKLLIDPVKKTVSLAIKGVVLKTALNELGVKNENTVAPGKQVFIPVVINVNSGELVVGDKFLFLYKSKFNSGSSGKFSQ